MQFLPLKISVNDVLAQPQTLSNPLQRYVKYKIIATYLKDY